MRERRFAAASIVALAGMIGCGIDALGTGPSDGGGVAPSPTSTSTSGPGGDADGSPGTPAEDAGPGFDANAAPLATCKDLPASWGLVAFVSGSDACPVGFGGGTTELRSGPKTRANTCTCECAVTTPPTCARSSAGAYYDNDNSNQCNLKSSAAWDPPPNGACSTNMYDGAYTTNHDWKFAAPALTGGTCSSSAAKHNDRLDFDVVARACTPTAGCEGAPPVTAPARRCVLSEGDVACPAGPFTKRTVFGRTFDVSCTADICGCTVTGLCSDGKMSFYTNADCTGSSFSMTANGNCQNTPTQNFTPSSYKYTATLSGAGCLGTGVIGSTVSTTTVATVCCE